MLTDARRAGVVRAYVNSACLRDDVAHRPRNVQVLRHVELEDAAATGGERLAERGTDPAPQRTTSAEGECGRGVQGVLVHARAAGGEDDECVRHGPAAELTSDKRHSPSPGLAGLGPRMANGRPAFSASITRRRASKYWCCTYHLEGVPAHDGSRQRSVSTSVPTRRTRSILQQSSPPGLVPAGTLFLYRIGR